MAAITLIAQDVLADPFIDGSVINIVNSSTSVLTFEEIDGQLSDPAVGETVSIDGGPPITYQFLGYGYVRGDLLQYGAFIRVEVTPGTFQTFAIDMNRDGDQQPNLATGNTKLTVADLVGTPVEVFPPAPNCFTPACLIETDRGMVSAADLEPGDLVRTRDNGFQPLREILSRTMLAHGPAAPVHISKGALGTTSDLVVSQHHGICLSDWRCALYFGAEEVLVSAVHLVNGSTVRIREGGAVTYIHLVFDRHEILYSAGIPTESLLVEVRDLLLSDVSVAQAARPRTRKFEAVLVAA